jgi:preprotein translocase subunit SecG
MRRISVLVFIFLAFLICIVLILGDGEKGAGGIGSSKVEQLVGSNMAPVIPVIE